MPVRPPLPMAHVRTADHPLDLAILPVALAPPGTAPATSAATAATAAVARRHDCRGYVLDPARRDLAPMVHVHFGVGIAASAAVIRVARVLR
jgi:hypothetical protein